LKENERAIVGKIIRKTKGRIVLAHWKVGEDSNSLKTRLVRCEGCCLGNRNDTECLISKSTIKQHQILKEIIRKEKQIAELRTPLSAYLEYMILSTTDEVSMQVDIQVKIANFEEAIIQRVIKEGSIQAELIDIARKLQGRDNLDIYTDGSLVNREIGSIERSKIGIG